MIDDLRLQIRKAYKHDEQARSYESSGSDVLQNVPFRRSALKTPISQTSHEKT